MSWDPDLLVCANLSLSIKGAGKDRQALGQWAAWKQTCSGAFTVLLWNLAG